jgi:GNAT superfamily N-acetyltransferase
MYTLRTSISANADFAYETVKTTMRDFAIQTWGTWHDQDSKNAAIQDTKLGKIQIIYVGNERAGTLQYETTESEILVNQIYLLPPFQNRGIGGEIISKLQEKSRESNLPIKLSVLRVNSATEFYLKKGFVIEKVTVERVFMQYAP